MAPKDPSQDYPFLPPGLEQLVNEHKVVEDSAHYRGPNSVVAEMFEPIPHETIYASVQALSPGAIGGSASNWTKAALQMYTHATEFAAGIATDMRDGWRGAAASSAQSGVNAVTTTTAEGSGLMTNVGNRLLQASEAASVVKAGVPQPISVETRAAITAVLYPDTGLALAAAQKEAEAAHREAVRVMNTVYKGAFLTVGNGVPGFTMPTDPTNGGGANGTDEYVHRLNSFTSSESNNASGADNSRTAESVANTNQTDPNAVQQGQNPASTKTNDTTSANPTSTTATRNASADQPGNINGNSPTADNSVSRGPVATGVNPQSPNFFTSPTGPNLRRQDDKSRDNANANLGMGMLGGTAAVVGADSLRQGPSVAANAVAAKSVPSGMMPHAARAAGDEDKEHKTPSYLVNVHNGTELIGPIDPAAPPVLGEWKEA
ncbi:hypothetical protein [Antrihabitans stalactiti]|uniref:PPE family protein n=1 Tax=Antrihabitans stalactiti TaxID=2584121 RepID=A0A848KHX7_9NOCA|nr:hypothetical protein [Antrihabitans stalactiti]NMN97761.1 hypothetical protein [Antrihabitans stalactiti]